MARKEDVEATRPDIAQAESLYEIGEPEYRTIPLTDKLAWLVHRIDKFVQGGIYLLAGHPGIGKSTLGLQIALDVGAQGIKTLYILNEQSKEDLAKRARMLLAKSPKEIATAARKMIMPEDAVYDISNLPEFLSHKVLSPNGKYHGVKLIVLDSVQGQGLSSSATTKYRELYAFCRACKSANITVLLISHVTKAGEIAGPKGMEHNVDTVMLMRKAMIYRPMFIPKNRFGPAVFKPIPLLMDKETTELRESPHTESSAAVARTYIGRMGGIAEAQAIVSLPAYGLKGKITAPNLPRKEIEQLINCISRLPELDIDDLDYSIHCRIPEERIYRSILGLPLAMSLIASYIQRTIPQYHIYLGEIDLLRQLRELPEQLIMDLAADIDAGNIQRPVAVFCPSRAAQAIRELGVEATVIECSTLDDAVFRTWSDLREASE